MTKKSAIPIIIFSLLMIIWFFLLEIYISSALVLISIILAFKFKQRVTGIRIFVLIAVLLTCSSAEFFYRMEKWSQEVRHSPASISDANLAGLYVLHGVMTFVGYVPFPEVGKEAFVLQFGNGESKTWQKNLSLTSDKLSRIARSHERTLTTTGKSRTTKLSWKRNELNTYSEIRIALAVGCQRASLKTEKRKDGFSHTAFCRVSYPNSRMQIARVGSQRLFFDEGLFLLLEKKGWFRPYDVRWKWKTQAINKK